MKNSNLDSLTPQELGKLFPIEIVPYNPVWSALFEMEKKLLNHLLGSLALRIEHFGSTSVPGLTAKPTIDILIGTPDIENVNDTIKTIFSNNGYIFMEECTDHLMFVKGYTEQGIVGQAFHIHLGTESHSGLWNRIYFRDYLIKHPEIACEYVVLKKKLAEKFHYDREAYTEGKSEFVKRITDLAVREHQTEGQQDGAMARNKN